MNNQKNEIIYNNKSILERAILSCLLMKPELTEKLIVTESDFSFNRGMFLFMTNFYKIYKNYDLTLMSIMTVEKTKLANNIQELILYCEPTTANFEHYQKALQDLKTGEEEEKKKIREIIDLTLRLKSRIISVEDFKKEIEKI